MDLTNPGVRRFAQTPSSMELAAGWTRAPGRVEDRRRQAFRALAAGPAYVRTPHAPLAGVDGERVDMDWQTSLNTFKNGTTCASGNWLELWEGQTGLAVRRHLGRRQPSFSLRYGPVHRVDGALDVERDKVVNDLVMTGCIRTPSWPVPGPAWSADSVQEGLVYRWRRFRPIISILAEDPAPAGDPDRECATRR